MRITEVKVQLDESDDERLRAYCSITIDDEFVVKELRVIEGKDGFFVAMPSRRIGQKCHRCAHKNAVRSFFCGMCGDRLMHEPTAEADPHRGFADVAHPINRSCRQKLQTVVLDAFNYACEQNVLGTVITVSDELLVS